MSTAEQLKKHIDSLRSQHGRLTNQKTGQAREDMTERNQWIYDTFSFLNTHIVRVPSRSSGKVITMKCFHLIVQVLIK